MSRRWFVRGADGTDGPVDEETVVEWIREGMFHVEVREEHGGQWGSLEDSSLAVHIPPRPKPRRSRPTTPHAPHAAPSPPVAAPTTRYRPQKKGLGCGAWLVIAVLSLLTIGACTAAPHIGWTGWALIAAVYFIVSHMRQQEERIAELESRRVDDEPDDFRGQW